MFKVKDFMTKDVICTEKDTTISEIIDKIHRVPVTENGKLVGLITEGMISNSGTSQATSLSIYELNYLLSKTTVETVMVKNVVSVDQDELMEYATSKIGIAKIKKGRYIKGVPASIIPVIERVDNINPANKAPESPIKILAGL